MKKLRSLPRKNFRYCRIAIIITLGLGTVIGFGCGGGGESSSRIEETTVPIFEETFDEKGMWSLSTNIPTLPGSSDEAWATIQNGRLELGASQGFGCVSARASLENDLTVSSDNIEIEIDFPYFDSSGLGGADLILAINRIRIYVYLSELKPRPIDDGSISTLKIEHRRGNTSVYYDGVVVSENSYYIEQVNWDGLRIAFIVGACGADAFASAYVEVDYIGIFEIKPI